MAPRHAQKSSPSARPRSARWKAWECALTKPGRVRRAGTSSSLLAHELDASTVEQLLEIVHGFLARVVRPQPAAVAKDRHGRVPGAELHTLDRAGSVVGEL